MCQKHKPHLERFVEKILHSPGNSHGKTERITDDVESEQDDVHLFDSLAGVVPSHLRLKVSYVVELVLPLKVSKSEDDVVAVCDSDAKTLEEMFDEV